MLAAYNRVQTILYQSKLLHGIKHAYKATLLSSLNLFTTLATAGSAAILGKLVGIRGYQGGHITLGLIFLTVGLLLWIIVVTQNKRVVSPANDAARSISD